MPAPTTISIADATPTAHVYRPISIGDVNGNSTLINTESTTNAGNRSMVLGYSFASPKRRTDKVQVRLNFPKEVTDTEGNVVVKSTGRFIGEYIIPDDWSETERSHFFASVKNLAAHAVVEAYVKSRDPFYG